MEQESSQGPATPSPVYFGCWGRIGRFADETEMWCLIESSGGARHAKKAFAESFEPRFSFGFRIIAVRGRVALWHKSGVGRAR
jgi:hypothetical protein